MAVQVLGAAACALAGGWFLAELIRRVRDFIGHR
jgi:hypothetical protein